MLKRSGFGRIYWTLHEEYAYRSGLKEDRHCPPFNFFSLSEKKAVATPSRGAEDDRMATFTRVLSVSFMLIAALGGCVLVYNAFGELFRRRPNASQARVKKHEVNWFGWR